MLRWLRILVTALAAVMGIGMLVIAALLWLRLSQAPLPELPEQIALPEGAAPAAVTFARDWLALIRTIWTDACNARPWISPPPH